MLDNNYPDFIKSTGYGNVAGLCGANCRHSFSPFYPGISEPRYSPERLKEMSEQTVRIIDKDGNERAISIYEATQIQRNFERKIRNLKKQIEIKEAARAVNPDTEPPTKEKVKLKETRKRLGEFIKHTGLTRQPFRERTAK